MIPNNYGYQPVWMGLTPTPSGRRVEVIAEDGAQLGELMRDVTFLTTKTANSRSGLQLLGAEIPMTFIKPDAAGRVTSASMKTSADDLRTALACGPVTGASLAEQGFRTAIFEGAKLETLRVLDTRANAAGEPTLQWHTVGPSGGVGHSDRESSLRRGGTWFYTDVLLQEMKLTGSVFSVQVTPAPRDGSGTK